MKLQILEITQTMNETGWRLSIQTNDLRCTSIALSIYETKCGETELRLETDDLFDNNAGGRLRPVYSRQILYKEAIKP